MSDDPRIIREGGYQGILDPGPPPASAYQQQVVAPTLRQEVDERRLALQGAFARRGARMIDPSKVKVEATASGGIKVIIPDDGSDSLAIVEVNRRFGHLSLRAGLRGNFSMAYNRGMRWVSTRMDAPDVSEPDRLRRKARVIERGGHAIKGEAEQGSYGERFNDGPM